MNAVASARPFLSCCCGRLSQLRTDRLELPPYVQVNYWPSNVEHAGETQQAKYMKTFYSSEPINGQRVKEDLFVGDDYIQAGDRIRSMDEGRSASHTFATP